MEDLPCFRKMINLFCVYFLSNLEKISFQKFWWKIFHLVEISTSWKKKLWQKKNYTIFNKKIFCLCYLLFPFCSTWDSLQNTYIWFWSYHYSCSLFVCTDSTLNTLSTLIPYIKHIHIDSTIIYVCNLGYYLNSDSTLFSIV